MKQIQTQKGFTLIEILVAVAIFGVLSVGAYTVLDAGMRSREQTEERLERLEEVQRAVSSLERDLMMLVKRPVRDEFGDQQPLLVGDSEASGQIASLAFTRSDWRNPAELPRSNLQHVMYSFEDGELKRANRLFLDAASNSPVMMRTLLKDVKAFQIGFLNRSNQWLDAWGRFSDEDAGTELPELIKIRLEVEPFGEIERIIPMPANQVRDS